MPDPRGARNFLNSQFKLLNPKPSTLNIESKYEQVDLTVWCALKLRTVRFLPQWIRTVPWREHGSLFPTLGVGLLDLKVSDYSSPAETTSWSAQPHRLP